MSSKYRICVSGGSKGASVEEGYKLAASAGEAIAAAGHSLITGATTGLPDVAATAYKKAGGQSSVGLSPAASKVEHVLKYRLPFLNYDAVLYTGLHYVGRDVLLINSSDGVISVGGRFGTLHEFTIAMETATPFGLLHGGGGISLEIERLIEVMPSRQQKLVVMDSDAGALLKKLTALIDKIEEPYRKIYNS